MDKFKRFRFFFYLPIIIIGLLCTIVFDWALYVQEEKTLQNWMQQIADAEILRLNRAMDRYINISAAIEDHLMENRGLPPGGCDKIHPNKKGSAPDHLVRGRAFRVIIFLQ